MKNVLKHYNVEQNSEEWYELKLGVFSASSANDLMMDKSNKGYQKLIVNKLEERITKAPVEGGFKGNEATERGHEYEPIAIAQFESESFYTVERCGFYKINDWVGCSPDGLIKDNMLIQVKCPIFSTQYDYLESQNAGKFKIPRNYLLQMQFELMVTGRQTNIFYSYHPKLPSINIPVQRDEEIISQIIKRLDESIKLVKEKLEQYK